ncbi:bifunctional ADP-dependent (S)-NAD(P)H-hydrate dehydratase/NAD(P)H-hydrate epimerase [Leptolyngbya sp. BL0902]|uniref:NAD(P)H-hydrate dehydratase n=1 Tax=Leptolyngbya sp. BL0902 TaxID=1115757 RepID=UPI0018E82D29|nr:NAD(P)H-hydrate dehydratase [Leptolyngbya sp. BL0902]QQE64105.1 bifunctional ADP-dependent (S)-NAD(P)H-hydrate dehydratase/NAD(P)H-hydrate epimerase [Leptolyngbya sp. BL0902]
MGSPLGSTHSGAAVVAAPSPDWVVTAATMQAIETAMFEAGMPVAALMEKAAQRLAAWVMAEYPSVAYPRVAVLVGPGHNGGDALVVAREMAHRGYSVQVLAPTDRHKSLTADHLRYVCALGVPIAPGLSDDAPSQAVDLWIDGLFGFGLERSLEGSLADLVAVVNAHPAPVVSLDLPSGLHTDTGNVLGVAVRATHTLCLGLWKRAFCQDVALPYLGHRHRIDFDIPPFALAAGLNNLPPVRHISTSDALARLPLPRAANCHKYQVSHLLIVAGSRQYAGAALLAGLGARASGVGMLTLAVPESLRWMVVAQLPEALVIGCPETDAGAIAQFPTELALNRYDAITCGPGLSRQAGAVVDAVCATDRPLLLDADALNHLAERDPIATLAQRPAPTLITPHLGEFRRLFPDWSAQPSEQSLDSGQLAQAAAAHSQSIVVLKGACTAIAHPDGRLWFNADSTPGLARGGSGDVLTGLMGGLLAQAFAPSSLSQRQGDPPPPSHTLDLALDAALAGVWWHSQTAKDMATRHTELGVDGPRLAAALTATLAARSPTLKL